MHLKNRRIKKTQNDLYVKLPRTIDSSRDEDTRAKTHSKGALLAEGADHRPLESHTSRRP